VKGVFRRRAALLAGALVLVAALAVVVAVVRHGGPQQRGQARQQPAPEVRAVGPTVLARPKEATRPGTPGAGVGNQGGPPPEYAAGQLLVKFEDGTSAAKQERVLEQADAQVDESVRKLGVKVIDVAGASAGQSLVELDRSPVVEYVERDLVVDAFDTAPNDALWPDQWGPVVVKAPRAWDSTKGSSGVVVAVVDTGVDFHHPDLEGAFVQGYDFVNNDSDAADDDGHGTATAGVIAARTNNSEGQAGMCWRCAVMPVKVLDATGSGTTSSVAQGIVWATDHGAKVINLSLGSSATTQTLTDAVTYAAARGAVLVAAAGNAGTTAFSYPAADPRVISVAGATNTDSLYSWSNLGWVQVAAPGCNAAPGMGGGYVNFCGTSSATPVVSGLIALAVSAKPAATRDELRQALISAAKPLGGSVQYGLVDAAGTLARLGVLTPPPAAATPAPPQATNPATTAPPPVATPAKPGAIRAVFHGRLTGLLPLRRYVRAVGAGKLDAQLTFSGSRRLQLTIVAPSGKPVGRAAGRSPLRLARVLPAGTYRFLVSGEKRKAPFVLRISSAGA
jgi:subtilisin family serine protease